MPRRKRPSLDPAQVYRVKSSFVARVGGVRRVYPAGPEVYAADHPAVVQCPHNFVPALPVERATAVPGEARGIRPPRKVVAVVESAESSNEGTEDSEVKDDDGGSE